MSGGTSGYTDVDRLLAHLLAEVHAVLGDELIGFYLYGSLSLGDFDPESSTTFESAQGPRQPPIERWTLWRMRRRAHSL